MSDSQSKQLSDVMDRAMTATMRASKQAEIADQELEAKIRTLKADIMTCKRRMSAAANGPSGKALVERLKTLQRELDEMNATLLQHEGKRMAERRQVDRSTLRNRGSSWPNDTDGPQEEEGLRAGLNVKAERYTAAIPM